MRSSLWASGPFETRGRATNTKRTCARRRRTRFEAPLSTQHCYETGYRCQAVALSSDVSWTRSRQQGCRCFDAILRQASPTLATRPLVLEDSDAEDFDDLAPFRVDRWARARRTCRRARSVGPADSTSWTGLADTLGRARLARYLERRNVDASSAPGEIREQARPHTRGSGQGCGRSDRTAGPRRSIVSGDREGRRGRLQPDLRSTRDRAV